MAQSKSKNIMILCVIAAGVWLFAKYLLPIAIPFALAALLSLAAEPLVNVLQQRLKLPRATATGIGVSLALVLLVLTILVLGALLVRQLQSLVEVAPDLAGTARTGIESLQNWALSLANAAPNGIRPLLTNGVEQLFSGGTLLTEQGRTWILGLASGIVSQLPDSALSIGTWVLASFMFSAKLPRLRQELHRRLPESWHKQYLPTLRKLKRSVWGWLTAQLKLMAISFTVMSIGFLLLQIHHGFLWALVISFVDMLPILGTGTVLIPWSIVCFLQGNSIRAIGLLGVYACAALLRSVLEPKLLGKQLGLDSLVTLAAMYTGYRLWGISGMILSPLLTVTAKQLISASATD